MPKKIYAVVLDALLAEIAGKSVGERLPSEAELCRKFSCSRQTLRKALAELTERELLSSRQGSGTYIARDTGSKASREIALIVPSLTRFIYSEIVGGVESTLRKSGHRLSLYQAHSFSQQREVLNRLVEMPPDGVIVCGMRMSSPLVDYFAKLRALHVRIIISECPFSTIEHVSMICMDDFAAGARAAQLLIEGGAKDLCGIFPAGYENHSLRAGGFLCGMDRAGAAWTEHSTVFFGDTSAGYLSDHTEFPALSKGNESIPEENCRAIRKALETADGIFIGDLNIAYVISVLKELGREPGRDVALLSITDSVYLQYIGLPISALAHPKEHMGIAAAEMMLRLLAGGKNEHMTMQFRYVDRGSIRRI